MRCAAPVVSNLLGPTRGQVSEDVMVMERHSSQAEGLPAPPPNVERMIKQQQGIARRRVYSGDSDEEQLPIGEPYAGKPPVRFGGRGGVASRNPYRRSALADPEFGVVRFSDADNDV